MKLFQPCYLARLHEGGINRFPIQDFVETRPGQFVSEKHDFEISIYDSLRNSVDFGGDLILSAFSHWYWTTQVTVSVGNTVRVDVPLPQNFSMFAAPIPAAVMGPDNNHYFPHILHLEGNVIVIGTTAHPIPQRNPVGTNMDFIITVYAYNLSDNPGWKRILYDSLKDYSQHTWDLSVFKLATSVELFADAIFERFLQNAGMPKKVREEVLRSARNWDQKLNRVKSLIPSLSIASAQQKLTIAACNRFRRKVRKPRNEFAHSDRVDIGPEKAIDAFKATFDILWTFDHLASALETQPS